MKRFFDAELEAFRSHIMLMGELAVRQVQQAVKALVDGDVALSARVRSDDDQVDAFEVRIDQEAIHYMNMRGPVATELRLIIVGMKVSHDLERVGDEASSIAKRAGKLAGEAPLKPYVDLPRMAGIALEMLRDAMDCFLQANEEKALAICKRDAEVDALHKALVGELTQVVQQRPETANRVLELIFVSKSIERIADHATNIAEETVFLGEARDIRHTDEVKKTVPDLETGNE